MGSELEMTPAIFCRELYYTSVLQSFTRHRRREVLIRCCRYASAVIAAATFVTGEEGHVVTALRRPERADIPPPLRVA